MSVGTGLTGALFVGLTSLVGAGLIGVDVLGTGMWLGVGVIAVTDAPSTGFGVAGSAVTDADRCSDWFAGFIDTVTGATRGRTGVGSPDAFVVADVPDDPRVSLTLADSTADGDGVGGSDWAATTFSCGPLPVIVRPKPMAPAVRDAPTTTPDIAAMPVRLWSQPEIPRAMINDPSTSPGPGPSDSARNQVPTR